MDPLRAEGDTCIDFIANFTVMYQNSGVHPVPLPPHPKKLSRELQ
jgi:hypothetical protein